MPPTRHNIEPPAVTLRQFLTWIAYAHSCRPAWVAARHGDHDPTVIKQANTYSQWIRGVV